MIPSTTISDIMKVPEEPIQLYINRCCSYIPYKNHQENNPISTQPSNQVLQSFHIKYLSMSIVPSLFGGRRSSVFDPFSLDVWDPFRDFPISSSSDVSRETSALVNARVDWKETPEAHVFKADLPGIKKEEVKVEVEEGNILQITGERNVEKEDKNDKWHRVERSSGKFTRRFRLPENAKMDHVKAAMESGVLTITVPKEEVKKPDVKSIEISG
ncbi:putative small heat shock protein HSP20 [Helianthus debilis subsp. tardiflorus]